MPKKTHPRFGRIEVIAKTDTGYRALDLTEDAVRSAIRSASEAKAVFESSVASPYEMAE
jgi:type III restriction enzyme